MFDDLADAVADQLKTEADRLLSTGAVDLDAWDDNYALPKIMLTAIMRSKAISWYYPLYHKHIKEVKNLMRF